MHPVAFGTQFILNCPPLGRNTPQILFFCQGLWYNTTGVVASIKDIIASSRYTRIELGALCRVGGLD